MSKVFSPLERLESLRILGTSATLRDAAAQLGIAPSSLSSRIRSLEEHFGFALVERRVDGVSLTPAATGLLEQASPHLDALHRLVQGGMATSATVRVGAYEAIARRFGATVVRVLAPAPVELRTARSQTLLVALGRGELDVILVAGPLELDERFLATPFGEERLALYAPREMSEGAARACVAAGEWVGLAERAASRATSFDSGIKGAAKPRITAESFGLIRTLALDLGVPCVLPTFLGMHAGLSLVGSPSPGSRHEFVAVVRADRGYALLKLVATSCLNSR